MPTICTCKQTPCKMIMIEHYPCSVPCQFFLFPVLRHNIWEENLHHPHMPSADVYSNKSSMWFFSHHRVLQRTTPKATLHLFTHTCTWCSFLELYPLAACSTLEASWNGYSAVCVQHIHPFILYCAAHLYFTNWAENPISWNTSFSQFSFMSSVSLNSNWIGHDCS